MQTNAITREQQGATFWNRGTYLEPLWLPLLFLVRLLIDRLVVGGGEIPCRLQKFPVSFGKLTRGGAGWLLSPGDCLLFQSPASSCVFSPQWFCCSPCIVEYQIENKVKIQIPKKNSVRKRGSCALLDWITNLQLAQQTWVPLFELWTCKVISPGYPGVLCLVWNLNLFYFYHSHAVRHNL